MSIIRPAVTKLFSRWSEAIAIGLGVVIFGYLTIRSTGVILPLVYGAITLICAVTLFVAVGRARILGQSWSVSLNDLTSVVIETTGAGPIKDDIFWVIRDQFGSVVRIPNTAGGNETLFDAVSALDGVSFEQITAAMGSTSPVIFTIWRKG